MPDFFPLQLLLATLAGWVHRERAQVVAYLIEENRVLREYTYHRERPHQGLGNELIDGGPISGHGDVVVHERLGGLLNSYHRSAA